MDENVTMTTRIKYQINKKDYEKIRHKLLQKQNNRYISFKKLPRSYVELQNRLKAMEEKFKINDSENNQSFHQRNL